MNFKVILPFLGLLSLMGAGCAAQNSPSSTPTPEKTVDQTTATPSSHETTDHLAQAAGSRIDLEGRNSLKPGNVRFRFTLYGLDGHEFGSDDLKVAHEKKMHFLLVRDDMTQFQHLHPEYKNEKWEVTTNIAAAGDYQFYVDVEPIEEKPVVLRVPVSIGGPTANKSFPTPSTDLSAQSSDYTARLETKGMIKTKEDTTLTFALTKNNRPVADVGPYLGAYGHVVLLRHNDADDFFHVHPTTENKPSDGKVTFVSQFPIKGRYTLYTQFNVDGQVRTFPITIDVNEEGTGTDSTSPHMMDTSEPAPNHHGG